MENLWPEDLASGVNRVNTPSSILKEQGTLLGNKTNNLVIGEVRQVPTTGSLFSQDDFFYDFLVKSPVLKYSYRVFSMSHPITLYPLHIVNVDEDISKELETPTDRLGRPFLVANSEGDFKDCLKKIFSTLKLKKVISAIIAQSG